MNPTASLANLEPIRNGTTIRRRNSYLPTAIVAIVFVVLTVRLFRLIFKYAVNIFFNDQWDFNDATLFQKHSIWEMFTWQQGPHRQGLGALLEKLIEPHFRWNSRIESFVVGGVVVVAALCALYLKKRLYGHFSTSDVLIPAVFFIPGQFETLFATANFAHGPLPLLLIVLYCLVWTIPKTLSRYVLVLVINFVTIYTGFGLFLGVLTPILLVLDYLVSAPDLRLPRAYLLCAVAVSLVSFGSFFIRYKFDTGSDCSPFQPLTPKYYVAYMALMFSNFFGFKEGSAFQQLVVGITALIALLISLLFSTWQLVRSQSFNLPDIRCKRSLVVASLIAYCLLFCGMTAYGRLCSGLWTAHAPRYVIYLELGVLGLYFQVLNILRTGVRRLLLGALLISVMAASYYTNRIEMQYFWVVKQQWKSCYLQIESVDQCNRAVGFPIYPPAGNQRLQQKLDYLKQNRLNLFADSGK
jgi:hypothetical protein